MGGGKDLLTKLYLISEGPGISRSVDLSSQQVFDKELALLKSTMASMLEQSAHIKLSFFMEMLPSLQMKAQEAP